MRIKQKVGSERKLRISADYDDDLFEPARAALRLKVKTRRSALIISCELQGHRALVSPRRGCVATAKLILLSLRDFW